MSTVSDQVTMIDRVALRAAFTLADRFCLWFGRWRKRLRRRHGLGFSLHRRQRHGLKFSLRFRFRLWLAVRAKDLWYFRKFRRRGFGDPVVLLGNSLLLLRD